MSTMIDRYKQMMSLSQEEADEIKDDISVLDYTQKVRRVIVREMTKDGLPADNETIGVVLNTLNSMDRTSLGRMKIGVEQSSVDNDSRIIDMANRLRDYDVKPTDRQVTREELPDIDVSLLPTINFTKEQMKIGIVDTTAADFIARYEADNTPPIQSDDK